MRQRQRKRMKESERTSGKEIEEIFKGRKKKMEKERAKERTRDRKNERD